MRLIETEIKTLKTKVLDMAELVLLQLDHLVAAIESHDKELASDIRKKEKKIDKFDTKIDKRCERLIALHQPVADDLRFVFSTVKVNAFLEQIGDLINSIARKVTELSQPFTPEEKEVSRLPQLLDLTRKIFAQTLQSLFQEDADRSKLIFQMDDAIDEIHNTAYNVVVELIQRNPARAADLIQLLMIIKGFEKIADYAVNIAEESIFRLEGVMYRHANVKHLYKNDVQYGEEFIDHEN